MDRSLNRLHWQFEECGIREITFFLLSFVCISGYQTQQRLVYIWSLKLFSDCWGSVIISWQVIVQLLVLFALLCTESILQFRYFSILHVLNLVAEMSVLNQNWILKADGQLPKKRKYQYQMSKTIHLESGYYWFLWLLSHYTMFKIYWMFIGQPVNDSFIIWNDDHLDFRWTKVLVLIYLLIRWFLLMVETSLGRLQK